MKYFFLLFIAIFFSKISFCQKEKHGPFKEYYDNGQLKKEGYYRSNRKTGIWKEYHNNGILSAEYTFNSKGKPTGNKNTYFKNGNLLSQSTRLKNDDLVAKTFYDSGNMQSIMVTHKNKNSTYNEYFESGVLKVESQYVNQ